MCRKQSFLGFNLCVLLNLNDLSEVLEGETVVLEPHLLFNCISVEVLVAKSFPGQITQCYRVGFLQSENLHDSFFNCLSSHPCFSYLTAYLWFRKFCCVSYRQTRGCIS